jgi:hypothetical protein
LIYVRQVILIPPAARPCHAPQFTRVAGHLS